MMNMHDQHIHSKKYPTGWRMRLLDIFHHQHQGLVPVGAQCGDLHRWLLEENGGISDLCNGGNSWCFPITTQVLILKVLVSEEWVEVRVKEINMIFWGPKCFIRLKSHFHSSLPGHPAAEVTSLRWPPLQQIFHCGPWAVITSATARPLSFNSESMANFSSKCEKRDINTGKHHLWKRLCAFIDVLNQQYLEHLHGFLKPLRHVFGHHVFGHLQNLENKSRWVSNRSLDLDWHTVISLTWSTILGPFKIPWS